MELAAVVAISTCGVLVTILAAVRLRSAARRGAPRELQLGYLGIMIAATAISLLLLRLL